MRASAVILVILAVSCGSPRVASESGDAAPVAILANSPGTITVGDARLLIGLVDANGVSLASPERSVTVQVVDPATAEVVASADGEFLWTVPDARGLYVANVELDREGTMGVAVTSSDLPSSALVPLQVATASVVPSRGQPAPRSVTPTIADHPLDEITSDPTPVEAFYRHSLSDVVGTGVPVVAVFSTPAFCVSASCGPTLDIVESVAVQMADVVFVHVEIYTNLDADRFEDLELAPAVLEWRLPSEPWVFVIDGDGTIHAAFEGALGVEELEAAVRQAG